MSYASVNQKEYPMLHACLGEVAIDVGLQVNQHTVFSVPERYVGSLERLEAAVGTNRARFKIEDLVGTEEQQLAAIAVIGEPELHQLLDDFFDGPMVKPVSA